MNEPYGIALWIGEEAVAELRQGRADYASGSAEASS